MKKSPVIILSGYMCSGKGKWCKDHLADYTRIGVSDIVRGIIGRSTRAELQATAHLADQIVHGIMSEITVAGKEVIDGIRQPEIFHGVVKKLNEWGVPYKLIWVDATVDVLKSRFEAKKDDGKENISFQEAFDRDLALGIAELERLMKDGETACLRVHS